MFSLCQKRNISAAIQKLLRETNHPELPEGEIQFKIHIAGAEEWSWANITNNGECTDPSINPHNEAQDKETPIFTMVEVESSNIAEVGWLRGTLRVKFKNGTAYDYADVPSLVFHDLTSADSAGKFFNSEIKGNYEWEKI